MAPGHWPGAQSSHQPPMHGQQNAAYQGDVHPYVQANGSNHDTATRNSYEQNHHAIPGLALGIPGGSGLGYHSHVAAKAAKFQDSASGLMGGETEEGEISEDDLEDIYEPHEPVTDSSSGSQEVTGKRPASDFPRERSGSYSPYLSAAEMDTDSPESFQPKEARPPSSHSLDEMKKRAQDAILRLKLANVQYQDFINEGIDKNVIDQLFGALGLGTPASRDKTLVSQTATAGDVTTSATDTAEIRDNTLGPSNAILSTEKDKSEERKDRIARLLAAKGSKSTQSSGAATTVGKVLKSAGGKSSSEKSKLLQKKMEALLKAREAQQQERARQEITDAEISEAAQSSGEHEALTEKPRHNDTDTLPRDGGSLYSKSGLTGTPGAPAAKLGNIAVSTDSRATFKRPFGQNRESRPFLIDVSDDDDDTDMEIDSPERQIAEQPTSSHDRNIRDEDSFRNVSTPASASTPLTSKGAGRPDLASMNKKIEAMRLKIAEAEARRKSKLSNQASPTDSPTLMAQQVLDDIANADLRSASPAISASLRDDGALAVLERSSSPQAMKGGRSRAASERLPLLESRRREQLLKLRALQSQVANIEKELKEGFAEEERLREDLDYISDDDIEMHASVTQPLVSNKRSPAQHADKSSLNVDERSEAMSSDQIPTEENSPSGSTGPPRDMSHGMSTVAEEDIETESSSSVAEEDHQESAIAAGAANEDNTAMHDVRQTSDDDADDDSAGYDPSAAARSAGNEKVQRAQTDEGVTASSIENAAAEALNAELISAGRQGSVSETERQDPKRPTISLPVPTKAGFIPYDSPLRYFHAFRFHPFFNDNVVGGLRSATFSNKIDAQLPLCPDETMGQPCPRGQNCHFQHFETMQAPVEAAIVGTDKVHTMADDQILLQLGEYSNCEDSKKQEYISGLRQLLTDFRNHKVKDFDTISQGIIEYRAKFNGDDSKILPLGPVSL